VSRKAITVRSKPRAVVRTGVIEYRVAREVRDTSRADGGLPRKKG
jgi:hypothetical protein